MKACIVCGVEKPLDAFTMRKRPPIQPYAACKSCEPMAYRKPKSYAQEVKALKDKARELHERNAERDAQIVAKKKSGASSKELAKEFGLSVNSINRVVRVDKR